MACRITELVLDCHDPRALSRFWCDVLGFEILDEDDGVIEVGPAAGPGRPSPTLVLVPSAGPRRGKPPLHIDVSPTDRDAEAELARLLALGARRVDIGQGDDVTWHVLADPEGNEFCLLRGQVDPA